MNNKIDNFNEKYLLKFTKNMNQLIQHTKYQLQLALAISGGSDSMCMLDLAQQWAKKNDTILNVIYINHNLRCTKTEQEVIKKYCVKHNIKFQVKHWIQNNKTTHNIQAQARKARYELLSNFCYEKDIIYILVAHHANDLTENILLKLSRQTGIFGLKTNKISILNNITIIRPIFNFTKEECISFLNHNNIQWVEDASNNNLSFKRNNLRSIINQYNQKNELSISALNSILHIESISSLITNEFLQSYINAVTISSFGYCIINEQIKKFQHDIQYLILFYALSTIRGTVNAPKMSKVITLHTQMKQNKKKAFTLHGCKICIIQDKIIIYRLFGKQKLNTISILINNTNHNNELLWDNRFKISVNTCENINEKIKIIQTITDITQQFTIQQNETIKHICSVENLSYLNDLHKNDKKHFLSSIPQIQCCNANATYIIQNNQLIFTFQKNKKIRIICEFYPQFKPQILYNAHDIQNIHMN